MTSLNRRHLIGLMGATALTGCAPALTTAQLGDDPFEGGIGGTGIVGLMTGSGSVLVNGLRVELPSGARIFAGGQPASDSLLVPGTALSMVARARLGRFEALQIDVDAPLIGTLTRNGRGYAINGTALRLDTSQPVAGAVGQRVIAHGLWQPDGSLRTSLLQTSPAGLDSVAGVAVGSPDAGWTIGQTPVAQPEGEILIAGQFAVVSGAFAAGTLGATSVQLGRFRGGQALRQLSIEGYLEPIADDPGFRISGLGHSFDRRLALDPFASMRALYFGPYDGRFRARRAVVLPERQGLRQALLRPAEDANFSAGLTGTAARVVPSK
ncbi:hypothetical protein [uncultured Tateyamaria sp.]|uniref:hypothetical protein n=1 Tax=uncultured Tateyamaria sp. TaxID=455651 RepID=UPI002601C5D4|nr:hypothetical protein [uncultured Tateyamaria sp.]